jgi:hypothetical protein
VNIETGKGHIGRKPEDIHDLFYKRERGKFIDERCEGGREDTQVVIVRKEAVCKGSEMFTAIGKLFSEDDLCRIDAIGTGNLALRIGTCLLRPGKFGIYPEYGAVFNTYGTSYAMLKIGFHYKRSSHIFAAATPVAIAVP